MGTKIEWTDETWNPVVGCTKVSEGCQNCYAERMAVRLAGKEELHFDDVKAYAPAGSTFGYKYANVIKDGKWNGQISCDESALDIPLHWHNPRQIFVCSMGDLFHESVPFEFIDKIYMKMSFCKQHIFQILTKRPKRMAEYHKRGTRIKVVCNTRRANIEWPLPNLWLGVTPTKVNDIDILLQIPAAHRFVSLEPLLSPVDVFTRQKMERLAAVVAGRPTTHIDNPTPLPDWVIVGVETGPKARYCPTEWIESVVEQCKAVGVPVFVKAVHLPTGRLKPKYTNQLPPDANVGDYALCDGVLWKCFTYSKAQPDSIKWRICSEKSKISKKFKVSKKMSEWPQSVKVRELPYESKRTQKDID